MAVRLQVCTTARVVQTGKSELIRILDDDSVLLAWCATMELEVGGGKAKRTFGMLWRLHESKMILHLPSFPGYAREASDRRVVAAPEVRRLLPTPLLPSDNVAALKPIDSIIDTTVAGTGIDRAEQTLASGLQAFHEKHSVGPKLLSYLSRREKRRLVATNGGNGCSFWPKAKVSTHHLLAM